MDKCDGNHPAPACESPQCWQRSPKSSKVFSGYYEHGEVCDDSHFMMTRLWREFLKFTVAVTKVDAENDRRMIVTKKKTR